MLVIESSIKRLKDNDSTLTELNLNALKISPDNIKALSDALARNRFLKIFEFSNNFIGPAATQVLAKGLESNKVLHTLYLRSNKVGDDGAKALAKALKNNDALENLYLGNNNIGPEGVKALADILSFNATLQVLSFRNNDVGNEACKVLASNLEINSTLQTLNLANSNITDEGALSLLGALSVNTTLRDIKLNFNEIEDSEITDKISARLKYNSSQNVVAVNAIAKKILTYCENYLEQEDLGDDRSMSAEELSKKFGLAKEDYYYLSSKNRHGGAIICLSSLFRMALAKYHEEIADLVISTANALCGTLFSCVREEMADKAIEKPDVKLVEIATNAVSKFDA